MRDPAEQELIDRIIAAYGVTLREAWRVCKQTRKQAWETHGETLREAWIIAWRAYGEYSPETRIKAEKELES